MMEEIKTIEQYRERLIEAFHNAGADGLICLVCLPDEKEFQALERVLRMEYTQAPKVI